MATRFYLANWECLVDPIEYELHQLGRAGFTLAVQTAMYHKRNSSHHERQRHEQILFEELTKLHESLQRATDYVNQMMHELEPHSSKRRRTTEHSATSEGVADGDQMADAEDEWKGAGSLLYEVADLCQVHPIVGFC